MSSDGSAMSLPATPSRTRYPFAAVLFDMDGVIVDDAALHRQVWEEFLLRPDHQRLCGRARRKRRRLDGKRF